MSVILPPKLSVAKVRVLLALAFSAAAFTAESAILDPNAFASLGSLSLTDTSGAYVFDTGAGGVSPTLKDHLGNVLFTGTLYNGIGVFDFSSVSLGFGTQVLAVGPNPLALLSQGNVTLAGHLGADGQDASGAIGGQGGAGGGKGGDAPFGAGEGPGGGVAQGGLPAFGQGGGFGGHGGNGFGDVGGVAYGDLHTQLQGGSGGGASGANLFGSAAGGGGGGAIELGASGSIVFNSGGSLTANGGVGGGGTAIQAGGGSGGGLLIHALSVAFVGGPTNVSAEGSTGFGGGGRILFLTASGTLDNLPSNLSANAAPTGGAQPGVIEYGQLAAVPVPAALWLFGSALAGLGLGVERKHRRHDRS